MSVIEAIFMVNKFRTETTQGFVVLTEGKLSWIQEKIQNISEFQDISRISIDHNNSVIANI